MVKSNDAGVCGAAVTYTSPVGTDNCSGSTTVQTAGLASGAVFPVGTTTNTFTVTDASGNKTSCSFTVMVNDTEAPSITCPAPTTVSCGAAVPAAATNYNAFVTAGGTATDNCSGKITVTHVGDVTSNQTCVNRYTITRTYRATDAAGNSSTCTQTIKVNDQTAPVINCPANITIQCGQSIAPSSTGTATATDNCGTVTIGIPTDVTTSCADGNYVILRTWTATDACGNSSKCTQTITVNKIKTVDCFSVNLLDVNFNGTNTTFSFRICANGCANALSNVAFVLGSNIPVVSPGNSSTYNGTHNKYKVSVPVSKNVYGVRYEVIGEGIQQNNECDVFVFTLAGDRRNIPISVQIKAGSTTSTVSVDAAACSCKGNQTAQPITVAEQALAPQQMRVEKFSATAFPNPTISQFNLKLTSDNSIDPITVRVIHEMGKVVEMRSKLTPGQTIQLGGAYRPGTYFVQIIQGKAMRQIKVIKTQY
jgi:hypothetical protein